MGRIPRNSLLYDGCYVHIISRSIAKVRVFQEKSDFEFFKKLLLNAKKKFNFKIFHYCLMNTHFHLVVTINKIEEFSSGMKQIKWEYTRKYNDLQKRRGPLWQNRYKSLLIENEAYLYACGIYVENNPVRAGLVDLPEQWYYSSNRHYSEGKKDLLIDKYEEEVRVIPDDVDVSDGLDFERGFGIGSDWFKYKIKKDVEG